ncbi:hypothetical protein FSP39_006832 [Pinctada imbricata]|uniref:Ig-like domain-containing protein n=1 Tax=Pinctada imbricata TaxID=66713 RepID=A0AA88Y7Y6_PINIB|nr:hypothetical protein FSP39_006832 [Pinctada imbricata]
MILRCWYARRKRDFYLDRDCYLDRKRSKREDRKIHECATTIESLRKSLLELQLENESLSLKLQEEISNRADIQQRINTTREICAYVKEHSLTTDSIMEKCTEEKEELRALQNEQQKKFEVQCFDLAIMYHAYFTDFSLPFLDIIFIILVVDFPITKEREKNVLSERTWTEKLVEAELKLKDLMYLCDEKDIEIRDIRTVVNKNEDKIHDLNNLIDNLQSQLHSTQENLNQTESRLIASEKNLCSSKADVGTLEKKVKEVSEHHMIKVASEKALQEELESLRKAREADLKVFNEEVDMLKKIITDDKQRINDLGTLLERTDNAVEELKSARDILIMEKCEIEAKLHQLLDEKLNVERCHSSEKERAEQLKNHLSNVKKELENSKAVADQQKELLKQLGEDLDASNTEKVNQHNELTTITCEMNRKIEEVNQLKQEILFSEEQKQQLLFKVEEMEGHLKEKRELFCKIEGQLEESKEEIMKLQAHIKEKNNNIEELQIHIQGKLNLHLFSSSIFSNNVVTVETDDDNVTLSTVSVSLNPTTTYYTRVEDDELRITCTANCDPPCKYQWYHQNFQVNGSVLNVNVIREMDYQLYGPLFCLAFNDDYGPFSSTEIRIYVLCKFDYLIESSGTEGQEEVILHNNCAFFETCGQPQKWEGCA